MVDEQISDFDAKKSFSTFIGRSILLRNTTFKSSVTLWTKPNARKTLHRNLLDNFLNLTGVKIHRRIQSKGEQQGHTPPFFQFLSFSCSFRQKSCLIIAFWGKPRGCCHPLPPSGISWIRHWNLISFWHSPSLRVNRCYWREVAWKHLCIDPLFVCYWSIDNFLAISTANLRDCDRSLTDEQPSTPLLTTSVHKSLYQ